MSIPVLYRGERYVVIPTPDGVTVRAPGGYVREIPWGDVIALPAAYAVVCDGEVVACEQTRGAANDRAADLASTGCAASVVAVPHRLMFPPPG